MHKGASYDPCCYSNERESVGALFGPSDSFRVGDFDSLLDRHTEMIVPRPLLEIDGDDYPWLNPYRRPRSDHIIYERTGGSFQLTKGICKSRK